MKKLQEASLSLAKGALLMLEYSNLHMLINDQICKTGFVEAGKNEFENK